MISRRLVLIAIAGCSSSSAPTSGVGLVDAQRFSDDLDVIAAPRPPASAHWQSIQDLCADRLAALGFEVERHQYATGVNVIGTRPGTRLPDEHVLVSAHYDSVNTCAGADDNASGVAGTLEAARVLALQPHARTLVAACWDEEERGLIGSRAYAQRALASGDVITNNFVLETMGFRSSEPNSQLTDPKLDAAYPEQTAAIAANEYRGDFILVIHDEASAGAVASFTTVAETVGLPVIALPVSEGLKTSTLASGLRRSDHAPFWDVDYPGVQVTDTADFRNRHYHCIDGPDVVADIDIGFATQVIQSTVGALESELDR